MNRLEKASLSKLIIPFSDDRLRCVNTIANLHSNFIQSIHSYSYNSFDVEIWLEAFEETPLQIIDSLNREQIEALYVQSIALFYMAKELDAGFIDFTRFHLLPGHNIKFPLNLNLPEENEISIESLICLFRRNPHFKSLDEKGHRDIYKHLVRKYTFFSRDAYVYRFDQFTSHYLITFPITELRRDSNVKINIKTGDPVREMVIKHHLSRAFQSLDIFFIDAGSVTCNLPSVIAKHIPGRSSYTTDDPMALIRRLSIYLQESAYQTVVLMVDHLNSIEDARFINYLLDVSDISGIVMVTFNTIHDFLDFDLVLNETSGNLLDDYLVLEETSGDRPLISVEETDAVKLNSALTDNSGSNRLRLENLVKEDDAGPAELLIKNHIEKNPESGISFKLKLARIYRVLRDYPRMYAILEELKGNVTDALNDEFCFLNFIYFDNTSDIKTADRYYEKIEEPLFLHLAHVKLSDRYIYGGNYMKAETILNDAVSFFRSEKYMRDELEALSQSAKLFRTRQEFDQAETLYKNIFIRSGVNGFPLLSASIAVDLGNLYYVLDRFDHAEAWYKKALKIFQSRKDKNGVILVRSNLADIYKFKGDWQTSRKYLKASLTHSKYRKSATSTAIDYYNIAELEYLKRNEAVSREYLRKAAQIFKKKKDVDHTVVCEFLKMELDFLFPPKGEGKKILKLDINELKKYRKYLSPDQLVVLSIFSLFKDGSVPRHKKSLVLERINRLKSARLRFDIITLLLSSGEMPQLIEHLRDLSRHLSKESRNYYFYEYYYIYFDSFYVASEIYGLYHPPEDHDPSDRELDIFMEMYYFFSRNKRRLSYRIKTIKDMLDERDSVYDVFKSAELVGDYVQWKVPGDFFNSLVKELKKIVPVELVKLEIYEDKTLIFEFSTDTMFGELTAEITARTVHSLENMNHTLEEIVHLYGSKEKAFYPYRNTKTLLWKISATLSGILLLGFRNSNYHDYDVNERGRKLLRSFASLIETYYEKDYRINEKLSYLIGESPAVKKLKQQILKVGKVPFSVLIKGDSGSGKELVARGVHLISSRSGKPFIPVNAAAIPENLLEAELFGYKKGAFTGAVAGKTGLIESAHGGTLFLDEIADLPLNLQAKMLRVLQENEIRRLGETHTVTVDFRLISATNKDLTKLIKENLFREDFYFRIQDLTIDVPPLKDRLEDIPLLVRHFLDKYKFPLEDESEYRRIVDYFRCRPWPGNVRELESCVKRLITYYPDFDMEVGIESKQQSGLIAARESMERELIHNTLLEYKWNKMRAAQALKISRQYLSTLVEKYRLQKGDV